MKIKNYLLLVMLFMTGLLAAQSVTVTGVVKDERNDPVPMAAVMIKGTTDGVLADIDGNYSIEIDMSQTLVFHVIGYDDVFVPLTDTRVKKRNGAYVCDIKLKSSAEIMDELVVVGYGSQKKETMTSAVSDVSGLEIRKMNITNMSQAVSETMPGVFGSIQSGQPGMDDAKLTIRGRGTWGNTDPLILIDGMQTTGGFEQLDAGEIESISVLKDAAATAPYGVLGANGVILVTTRRGNKGAPTVNASASITAKSLEEYPPLLDAYDVIQLGQTANMNGGTYNWVRTERNLNQYRQSDRNEIYYPDVDWYREMIKPVGFEHQARVNVSGGTDFVQYFSSLSYNHQGDIFDVDNKNDFYDPSFNFDKVNFRTNLDFNITKTTRFSTDISGRMETISEPNASTGSSEYYNVFKFLNNSSPVTFPKYYPEEFIKTHPDPMEPGFEGVRIPDLLYNTPSQSNPYYWINYTGMRKQRRDIIDLALKFEQDLDFITEGLTFSARYTHSSRIIYKKTYANSINKYIYDVASGTWRRNDRTTYNTTANGFHPSGGEGFNTFNRNTYYEAKLDYTRSFGKHNVNAMGVFNRTKKEDKYEFPEYHEDWVGRINYNYDSKYMMEVNAGYNGSEKFIKGARFGFFPSASVAWNLAKESFVADNLDFINNLKLRYSVGKVGNERGADRWSYIGGWGYYTPSKNDGKNIVPSLFDSTPEFGIPVGDKIGQIGEVKRANVDATWEESVKHNLGFDLGLLKGDLNINMDFYKEYRTQIYVTLPQASYYRPGLGFYRNWEGDNWDDQSEAAHTATPVNKGEAKSRGVEFVADYSHYFSNGITFGLFGNVNYADNRMVIKADRAYAPDYQKDAGKPIGWNSGYQTNGYLNTFEEAVNAPKVDYDNQPGNYRWADFNSDGVIDLKDRVPMMGTNQPFFTYGFGTSASYKGWDLRVRFFGKSNVYYGTNGEVWYPRIDGDLLAGKTYHLDTWTPENTEAEFPSYTSDFNARYKQHHDQKYVNAKYLRLQSVQMSYLLVSPWIKHKLNISTVRFNLTGNNLYTWTQVPFGDPEGGNSLSGGYGNYPLVRRVTFGIDLTF